MLPKFNKKTNLGIIWSVTWINKDFAHFANWGANFQFNSRIEMNWIELKQICVFLNWIELIFSKYAWIELNWIGFVDELNWIEPVDLWIGTTLLIYIMQLGIITPSGPQFFLGHFGAPSKKTPTLLFLSCI